MPQLERTLPRSTLTDKNSILLFRRKLLKLYSHEGPYRDSSPLFAYYVTVRQPFPSSLFGARGAIRKTTDARITVGILGQQSRHSQFQRELSVVVGIVAVNGSESRHVSPD